MPHPPPHAGGAAPGRGAVAASLPPRGGRESRRLEAAIGHPGVVHPPRDHLHHLLQHLLPGEKSRGGAKVCSQKDSF